MGQMVRCLSGKTSHEWLLHQLHCVALVIHGYSASEVARVFGDSPRAVSYWVKRFRAKGIAGFTETTPAGRPSKLNEAQIKGVQQFIVQSVNVTAETLSHFIGKAYNISLTVRQCARILKRFQT